MRFDRRFTTADQSPYATIAFRATKSEIRNPDGSVVFALDGIEIPATWSQVAADVIAQKYFRKAGVPARLKAVEENDVPSFLWRHVADEAALATLPEAERHGPEKSSKQVFDRLAGTWTYWGWKGGYFDGRARCAGLHGRAALYAGAADGGAELAAMVQHRPALGLRHRRPEPGPPLRRLSHRRVDRVGLVLRTPAAARLFHPVASQDDLVNEGGIMDLWVREARLFKYGSGTGSNFSKLRGENERLSGGGKSSGLMSFLKIGDRAAGAIKSGGTTRRAAKMVVVDADHPDIEAYIDWKVKRRGQGRVPRRRLQGAAEAPACDPESLRELRRARATIASTRRRTRALKKEIKLARRAFVPDASIKKIIQFARQGFKEHEASRPTRSTGIPTPTSPSPARTPTIPSASPTTFCARWRTIEKWDAEDPDHRQGRTRR